MKAEARAGLSRAALLRPGGLFDQAEAVLRRTLAAHPHDTNALRRLGDIQRGKGAFSAARDTYRCLHAADPGHPAAAWGISILRGDRVPHAARPGPRPVPFVRLTNFLTPAQQKWLFTLIRAGRERFVPAMVGKGNLRRESRTAWVANRRTVRAVRPWFGPKLRSVVPRAGAVAGGMRPSRPDRDGGDGASRRGILQEAWRQCRRGVSPHAQLVYYFHRQPRPFTGGDLLLYDTDPETSRTTAGAFTRIEPVYNSLVLYSPRRLSRDHPRRVRDPRFPGRTIHRERLGPLAERRRGRGLKTPPPT